jgi:Spy/CpxP family protein refolding chaperone
MKRTPTLWLAAIALTGATAISVAQTPAPDTTTAPPAAHAHGCAGMHGHHNPFMHVLHQLNLTADQKTQVHSIIDAAHPRMAALHSSSRDTLASLMATAPTDPNYPALIEKAKSNALAHIQLMSDLHSQIHAVLTPAQQAKIPAIVAAQKAKWQAHHGQDASQPM